MRSLILLLGLSVAFAADERLFEAARNGDVSG